MLWERMKKSPHNILGYLCCVYREKIAQHAANHNDDHKLFTGTDQQGLTQCAEMRQEMRIMPAAKNAVEKKRRAEHYRGGLSLNEPSSVESDLHPPVYISLFLSTLFSKISIFLFIFLNPCLLLVHWLCIFIIWNRFIRVVS